MGEDREVVGGWQERRRKVEETIWKGEVQSRPKLVDEGCMELQVDMEGGLRVMVEVV